MERFQAAILHERTLEGFLTFYNYRRPHQRYRVRARTPAMLFWGLMAA